jgi:hypothetical protein
MAMEGSLGVVRYTHLFPTWLGGTDKFQKIYSPVKINERGDDPS